MFKLRFAAVWGSHVENRTCVILTCCPLPGGSLPYIVTPALYSLPSTVLAAAPASVSFLALSPLLSPCSCLPLLLGLPSLPLLISLLCSTAESSWVLLLGKNTKARGYQRDYVRELWGSVSQNLILDLVRTSFAPRSDLVKKAANQNPARRVLERLCNGLSDQRSAMAKWISEFADMKYNLP